MVYDGVNRKVRGKKGSRKMKKSRLIRRIDWILIILLACLAVISIVAISSATHTRDPSFTGKQMIWYLSGFVVMAGVLFIDYRALPEGRFLYLLYGIGLFLLLLVYVPGLGVKVNGAQQWIRIGGFQFQPSEFMKLILILLMAKVLAEHRDGSRRDFRFLARLFTLFAIPFLIILTQPDLGTALVLAGILVAMLFVGGLDVRWFAIGLGAMAIIGLGIVWLYRTDHPLLHLLLKEHQIERIQIFLDPASDPTGAGYQATQAKIAIGSGMLTGKGFHRGTQALGNWIPEPHNDFVFAVLAEEFGFVGGSLLIAVYLGLIYRMIRIALNTDHPFGAYVTAGVVGMLLFQVYQNIGMTLGLMPITGIPLPLVSYGGSSLVTQLLAIGLVLGVGMRAEEDLAVFED
jgi:rod shape determining protein RodA